MAIFFVRNFEKVTWLWLRQALAGGREEEEVEGGGGEEDIDGQPVIIRFVCIKSLSLSLSLCWCVYTLYYQLS